MRSSSTQSRDTETSVIFQLSNLTKEKTSSMLMCLATYLVISTFFGLQYPRPRRQQFPDQNQFYVYNHMHLEKVWTDHQSARLWILQFKSYLIGLLQKIVSAIRQLLYEELPINKVNKNYIASELDVL